MRAAVFCARRDLRFEESRQKLAREFGATDIVTERGDEGAGCLKELTKGLGGGALRECDGAQESMMAIQSARPGGSVGYVESRTGSSSSASSCSTPTSAFMAAPLRCAAFCLSWSSWRGTNRSTQARSST